MNSAEKPAAAPASLTRLDHTADEAIVVRADARELLFARAALGMFSLLADLTGVGERTTVEVSVQADAPASLMRAWLSELNFLHVSRGLIFCRFEIRECTDTRLEARAFGETNDLRRHPVYTEIKAVTYHGQRVFSAPRRNLVALRLRTGSEEGGGQCLSLLRAAGPSAPGCRPRVRSMRSGGMRRGLGRSPRGRTHRPASVLYRRLHLSHTSGSVRLLV